MAKKRELWIAKDRNCSYYSLFDHEPTEEDYWDRIGSEWSSLKSVFRFCTEEFENACPHLKLKPGQFCKIKVEIVGDIWEFED